MNWLNAVLVAYSLLMIGGGIEGYLKTKSIPSIAAGVVIGLLVLGSVMLSRTQPKVAYGGAAVVTALTAGFFVMRYSKSQAVWPALTMVIASAIVLAALVVGHLTGKSAPTP